MTKTLIISTGSELLRGQIADTNGAWMAGRLDQYGIPPSRIIVAPDEEETLGHLLAYFIGSYDVILCGGGLGPTTDDITAQAAARAFDCPIERHPVAESQVRERFAQRKRKMSPVNLNQADLPRGATVLENRVGTAPAFLLEKDGTRAFFLPGPPAEMKSVFTQHIEPTLQTIAGTRFERVIRCFGAGESNLQELILPLQGQHPAVDVAYRASFPEVAIKFTGEDEGAVEAFHKEAAAAIGTPAFSSDNRELPQVLGELLASRDVSVATAESCTGGLICHELTQNPGASAYVKGGVVAYENSIKADHLNVSKQALDQHGAVSETVVRQMALGVQKALGAHIGIATSGIAGPSGGTPEKPVGTVHIAVAIGDRVLHKKNLFNGYSRTRVKTASAWTAMKMTLDHLLETIE